MTDKVYKDAAIAITFEPTTDDSNVNELIMRTSCRVQDKLVEFNPSTARDSHAVCGFDECGVHVFGLTRGAMHIFGDSLAYDASTQPGVSGGPIYRLSDGLIVGIHCGAGMTIRKNLGFHFSPNFLSQVS